MILSGISVGFVTASQRDSRLGPYVLRCAEWGTLSATSRRFAAKKS